jgi:TPR repeat protein
VYALDRSSIERHVIKPPKVPVTRYPIYLPDVPGKANDLFRAGTIEAAVEEYKRLAALGSKSAQAILAFLSLSGALDDKPDIAAAEAFAKDAAEAGDPYAQYVLAWVRYAQGRSGEGLKLLHRSATTGGLFRQFSSSPGGSNRALPPLEALILRRQSAFIGPRMRRVIPWHSLCWRTYTSAEREVRCAK